MLILSTHLWQLVLDAVALNDGLEAVAYIDGFVLDDRSVATTVTVPRASRDPAAFSVSASAMSEAGRHLRGLRMRRLAQVHTHPLEWVGHSPWDDANAYSQAPGAISIVLPHYGMGRPSPFDSGIHLRTSKGWQELDRDERTALVQVVPDFIDASGSNHDDTR